MLCILQRAILSTPAISFSLALSLWIRRLFHIKIKKGVEILQRCLVVYCYSSLEHLNYCTQEEQNVISLFHIIVYLNAQSYGCRQRKFINKIGQGVLTFFCFIPLPIKLLFSIFCCGLLFGNAILLEPCLLNFSKTNLRISE